MISTFEKLLQVQLSFFCHHEFLSRLIIKLSWIVSMKAIFTEMNTTWAVVKIRLGKNSGFCGIWTHDLLSLIPRLILALEKFDAHNIRNEYFLVYVVLIMDRKEGKPGQKIFRDGSFIQERAWFSIVYECCVTDSPYLNCYFTRIYVLKIAWRSIEEGGSFGKYLYLTIL